MRKLISWVEIPAEDMERAVKFYNALLGLELEILDFGTEKMACFPNDEGAISKAPDFNPSRNGVLVSLNMEDGLDRALSTLVKMGGEILKPKTKIEAEGRGYFALFLDSEGNKVGLYGDS
jgi:predicted enzyme related to lactoylglutathione lyase